MTDQTIIKHEHWTVTSGDFGASGVCKHCDYRTELLTFASSAETCMLLHLIDDHPEHTRADTTTDASYAEDTANGYQIEFWKKRAQAWRREVSTLRKNNAALASLLHQSIAAQQKLASRVYELQNELADLRPPF